jgi:hypothetical protein
MTSESEVRERLDADLEQLAVAAGAVPMSVPDTIPREVLQRAEHLDAFPGLAVRAGDDGTAFVPPAACYHVYRHLERALLDAPKLVTLAVSCARNEPPAADDPGRLRQFRMREVVFIGAPDWVARSRNEWMTRTMAFAAARGLAGAMEPATDTFFGNPGRGRRLIQQLKNLKYELRMDAGPAGVLAVASFNLHESFFTSRFHIRMADGSPVASGCAAFGIERWSLAYLHHGNAHLR